MKILAIILTVMTYIPLMIFVLLRGLWWSLAELKKEIAQGALKKVSVEIFEYYCKLFSKK
ncbi:MAG: hypothetical protein FWC41_11100 [Firmicutes bacterium]|nr:hypothetical protein [Bacillota bacterium]